MKVVSLLMFIAAIVSSLIMFFLNQVDKAIYFLLWAIIMNQQESVNS
jgi:hypothetical protein